MANSSDNHHQKIVDEIKRHLEDAEISRLQHYKISTRYEKRNTLMEKSIAIIMSLLILLLSSSFIFNFNPWNTIVSTVFSVGLIFLTTIRHIEKYDEKSIRHWIAAQSYQRMSRNCRNWSTDFPNNDKLQEAAITARMFRERMTETNRDSPPLEKWAWDEVKKDRDDSTRYDTTNQGIKDESFQIQ